MDNSQHTPVDELPFYRLDLEGEPMYCVCDHGGPELPIWCAKCPHRQKHHEAAVRDLQERQRASATGSSHE